MPSATTTNGAMPTQAGLGAFRSALLHLGNHIATQLALVANRLERIAETRRLVHISFSRVVQQQCMLAQQLGLQVQV